MLICYQFPMQPDNGFRNTESVNELPLLLISKYLIVYKVIVFASYWQLKPLCISRVA